MAKNSSNDKNPSSISAQPRVHHRAAEIQHYNHFLSREYLVNVRS